MTHEGKTYTADEGKTFRRKSDKKIMGNQLFLGEYIDGSEDKIANYSEVKDPNYIAPEKAAGSQSEAEPEKDAEPQSEAETEKDAEPHSEAETEKDAEPQSEAEPEKDAEPQNESSEN